MKRYLLAMTLLGVGCTQTASDPSKELGTVTVTEITAEKLSGQYVKGDDVLKFEASKLAEKVFQVDIVVHGLTLEGIMDNEHGVQSLDGYATADGADTQMVDDDRTTILQFVKALEKQIPDIATQGGAPQIFSELANVWAEWIPAMPLKFTKVFAQDRQTSWCGQIGSYQYTTHDCWTCSNGGNCTSYGFVGAGGSCGGDWWLWVNNGWNSCADQNHVGGMYGNGNCFARCGAGCGSGTTYSYECAKHDECVRNGHDTASAWCSNELSAACWTDCAPCGHN